MKTCVPEYYLSFHCIASGCVHNCCTEGWEIEIDDAHASRYKEIYNHSEDRFAEQVKSGVLLPSVRERREGIRPHIRLTEHGICPFWCSADGLCELIKNYGEDILCQICADHPRFRNFYAEHMEMGIGLCCEEAVRLVLNTPVPVRYVNMRSGEEMSPEHWNGDRNRGYREQKKNELDFLHIAEYLLNLDCLEPEWEKMLIAFRKECTAKQEELPDSEEFRRIEEYFLFRHLVKDGPEFVAFSIGFLKRLYGCKTVLPQLNPGNRLEELVRIFSSEIEYSEDAMEVIKRSIHT